MKTGETKDVKRCSWCDSAIAERLHNNTVLRLGNALCYHRQKFFCGRCERSWVWVPSAIPKDENESQQAEQLGAKELIMRELNAITNTTKQDNE